MLTAEPHGHCVDCGLESYKRTGQEMEAHGRADKPAGPDGAPYCKGSGVRTPVVAASPPNVVINPGVAVSQRTTVAAALPTTTGLQKYEFTGGYYDGDPCTCAPECPEPCHGFDSEPCKGCEACAGAYADYLSHPQQ